MPLLQRMLSLIQRLRRIRKTLIRKVLGKVWVPLTPPQGRQPEPEYDPTVGVDLAELPINDEVVIGRLDNGLTYYLRSDSIPAGQLTLRLAVRAGSVNEPEGAEGAARYLQRMLFKGTQRYPGDQLVQALGELGVAVGSDADASTSWDESVYEISMQTGSALGGSDGTGEDGGEDAGEDGADSVGAVDGVHKVLDILAQMASSALLASEDLDSVRSVLLDEYSRATKSRADKLNRALDDLYTSGTPYEGKHPIGAQDAIQSMTAETLREFYDTWYRPSNMAVVAVGDLPTSVLEELVREHFGGLEDRGSPGGAISQPTDGFTAELKAEPVIEPLAIGGVGNPRVSLDWAAPRWPEGTAGGMRRILMENVIVKMLVNRLAEEWSAGRLAVAASPRIEEFFIGSALRFHGTNFTGPDLLAATADLLSVLAGAAEFGFTGDEAAIAIVALRDDLGEMIAEEANGRHDYHADRYADHFLQGAYIDTAENRLNWYESQLDGFTADELSAHWRWLHDHAGPIVVPYGQEQSAVPTAEDVLAAIGSVEPRVKADPEEPINMLVAAPTPVEPVSSGILDLFEGYEAYEWEFGNGASVVFVESAADEDRVDLRAESLGGYSTGDIGDVGLGPLAVDAVAYSGLGDSSATQLAAYLSKSTTSASPWIGETASGVSGFSSSNPRDMEDLFALLHLYYTEPRVDVLGLREAVGEAFDRLSPSAPGLPNAAVRAYTAERHPENRWYRLPTTTEQEITAATSQSLLGVYGRHFDGADGLIVAVVGDADRETVAELAARYVGTLLTSSGTGEPVTYSDRRSPHPEGVTLTEAPRSDSDAPRVTLYYESPVEFKRELTATVDVLQAVLDDQMSLRMERRMGDSHTASASLWIEPAPELTVYSEFTASVPPDESEALEQAYDHLFVIIDRMIRGTLVRSVFDRAKAVVADDYADDYASVGNAELIRLVQLRHHFEDADLPTPDRMAADLEAVTARDVTALAAQLYRSGQRIEVWPAD